VSTPTAIGSRSHETIRFEAPTRARAESLAGELAEFAPRLVREDDRWLVEIDPDLRLTPLLLEIFHAVSRWLSENKLASVDVHFGDNRYTLLHPSDARPSHSAEFLLQRVIQLQTALDSRVVIEQAKGLLAGRLRLALDETFEIIRQAARKTGRQLHDLAEEIVSSEELPSAITHAIRERRDRHDRR
jgi:hypothetical protein